MNDLITILVSVTAVSLIAFIGIIFIGLKEEKLKRLTMILVGFASGTLMGGTFLHLLPESQTPENDATTVFWYVIIEIISFYTLEKFLYWRHLPRKGVPNPHFRLPKPCRRWNSQFY